MSWLWAILFHAASPLRETIQAQGPWGVTCTSPPAPAPIFSVPLEQLRGRPAPRHILEAPAWPSHVTSHSQPSSRIYWRYLWSRIWNVKKAPAPFPNQHLHPFLLSLCYYFMISILSYFVIKYPWLPAFKKCQANIIKADFRRNLKGKTLFESHYEETHGERLWLNPLSVENF